MNTEERLRTLLKPGQLLNGENMTTVLLCAHLVIPIRRSPNCVFCACKGYLLHGAAPNTWQELLDEACGMRMLRPNVEASCLLGWSRCRAEARARVVQMFMKAFGIDELTASYYLEEARGDVRAASVLLRRDLEWERGQHTAGGR